MNKAAELLAAEHRIAEALFARFDDRPERSTALEICDLLERHTSMEESVLYPALRQVDSELFEDAQAEHDDADELLGEIRDTQDVEALVPLVADLRAKVAHHINDEETEDLPRLEDAYGTAAMDRFGEEMARWLTTHHPAADHVPALAFVDTANAPAMSGAPSSHQLTAQGR